MAQRKPLSTTQAFLRLVDVPLNDVKEENFAGTGFTLTADEPIARTTTPAHIKRLQKLLKKYLEARQEEAAQTATQSTKTAKDATSNQTTTNPNEAIDVTDWPMVTVNPF